MSPMQFDPPQASPGRRFPLPGSRPDSGMALVIVLAFVVLLTGLVVAFFSRSVSERQVSNASVSQVRVEMVAQGAMDSILADLKQEIVAGSGSVSFTSGTAVTTLYPPTAPVNAVPALVGSTGTNGLENLIKRSAFGLAFYSGAGASNRAAMVSSTTPALNSHYISPARWNSHFLLAKANQSSSNDTDFTPVSNFTAPDWVLVTRSGSTPAANSLTSALRWTKTNSNAVVARYAYAIYNEGGLLDMNVAGFPPTPFASTSGSAKLSYKSALAFADLTQLPGIQNLPPATQSRVLENLAGFRNYASAAYDPSSGTQTPLGGNFPSFSWAPANGANWYGNILANTNGFLGAAPNLPLISANKSMTDHPFLTRQELMRVLLQWIASGISDRANLENALRYMGTFSRALNQPSIYPNSNRPAIVGPAYPGTGTTYSGGNSAYGIDSVTGKPMADVINPAFRSILVTGSFTRNSGYPATPGEPLVKKRFALTRLAWLTYKGPSADLYATSPNDPVITALLNYGIPLSLIKAGTGGAIKKYFGLTWTPGGGQGGIGGYWTYDHGFANTIGTLDSVASAAPLREPDFFELLKAGICVGSISKATDGVGLGAPSMLPTFLLKEDSRIDNQVIQIGANIIDQASPDCYPTNIVFNDGVGSHTFYGVDDMPYLYSVTNLNVLVARAIPNPSNPGSIGVPPMTPGVPSVSSSNPAFAAPNSPGLVAAVQVPSIWNPHSQSSLSVVSPSNLRICVSSYSIAAPSTLGSSPSSFYYQIVPWYQDSAGVKTFSPTQRAPWGLGAYNSIRGTIDMPQSGANGNTAMTFNYSSSLYREPTPLMRSGLPLGSNLALDSQNALVTSGSSSWGSGIPEVDTGLNYIGFYVGKFPLRWNVLTSGTPTTYTVNQTWNQNGGFGQTVSVEYQSGNNWIPYQQTWLTEGMSQCVVPCDYVPSSSNVYTQAAIESWTSGSRPSMTFWDPRSRRWEPEGDTGNGAFLDLPSPTTNLVSGRTITATIRPNTNPASGAHGYSMGGASQDMNIGRAANSSVIFTNSQAFITDPDGVIRCAMGAYVPGTHTSGNGTTANTTVGLPLATVNNNSTNAYNRPILLHRPFRTVAELGYVFSDTPWRNLDLFTPQSGFSALLDVFCINETAGADALVAGKVDLNTRQQPVLQAILSGAYRDEFATAGEPLLDPATALRVSGTLVARTSSSAPGKGPLMNIADLVGRYVSGTASDTVQPIYSGLSADLGIDTTTYSPNNMVSRLRETTLRALSDTGQAGTWNLLIDLVAQTGRYPSTATSLSNFAIDGERRYWLHVAIDRQTGKVIDQQIEQVNE